MRLRCKEHASRRPVTPELLRQFFSSTDSSLAITLSRFFNSLFGFLYNYPGSISTSAVNEVQKDLVLKRWAKRGCAVREVVVVAHVAVWRIWLAWVGREFVKLKARWRESPRIRLSPRMRDAHWLGNAVVSSTTSRLNMCDYVPYKLPKEMTWYSMELSRISTPDSDASDILF